MRAIISTPVADSKWLARCIYGLPKMPKSVFDPETPRENTAITRILAATFGGAQHPQPVCRPSSTYRQTLEDTFQAMIEAKELPTDTVEVWSFCRSAFLSEKFTVIGLIKHRESIFWLGNQPSAYSYLKIAKSFEENARHCTPRFAALIDCAITRARNDYERMVSAQFLASFVLWQNTTSVLQWERLVRGDSDQLRKMLEPVLPLPSELRATVSRIIETRPSEDELIPARTAYASMKVEEHIKRICDCFADVLAGFPHFGRTKHETCA